MVYIAFDQTHEWDDIFGSDIIVYVGTNKEEALNYFETQYAYVSNLPDDKYCYEYNLYEYSDTFKFVGTVIEGTRTLLKHIDNLKEE